MTGYKSKRAAAQDKLDSREREALKLALEALEGFIPYLPLWDKNQCNRYDLATTTIKAALAQPEQEPWRESASDYERGFIDGMQKQAQSSVDKAVNRMAQPEQKPVAWLTRESVDGCWYATAYKVSNDDKPLYAKLDEDEIIIQYHEATIKRLEKRIEELMAQPEQEPVAMLERDPSIGRLRVTYEDAVTELDEGVYPLYTKPQGWRDNVAQAYLKGFDEGCKSNAKNASKPVAWLEPEWGEKICPEVGYEVTMTDDHPRDLCWIPLYAHPPQGIRNGDTTRRWSGKTENIGCLGMPVNVPVTPPQRTWVGLTKEDMPDGENPMFDHEYFIAGMVFAANILKEKNNG